jgi:hypothetical protein
VGQFGKLPGLQPPSVVVLAQIRLGFGAQNNILRYEEGNCMNLQEQLCDWDNLLLAWQNAARGKRGRGATAKYELLLTNHLFTRPDFRSL